MSVEEVESELNIKVENEDSDSTADDEADEEIDENPDIQDDSVPVKVEPDLVSCDEDEDEPPDAPGHSVAVEITPRSDHNNTKRRILGVQGKPVIAKVSSASPITLLRLSGAKHNIQTSSSSSNIQLEKSEELSSSPVLLGHTENGSSEQQEQEESENGPDLNITLDVLKTENPLIFEYLSIASGLEFSPRLRYLLSKSGGQIYLSVSNKEPDLYLQYRNNLTLIVRSSESDLLCTLYNFKHQVFKSIVIKNFLESKSTVTTRTGIFLLLKELVKDRYRVCSGALAEDDISLDYSEDVMRIMLIEKFEGSIVYRHRDCFTLVPSSSTQHAGVGTSFCESCNQLKQELLNRQRSPQPSTETVSDDRNTISRSAFLPQPSYDKYPIIVSEDSSMDDCDQPEVLEIDENNEIVETVSKTSSYRLPKLDSQPQVKVKLATPSYKRLIYEALKNAPKNKLVLQDIYDWIISRHPQFKENLSSFQNSIRHNLSMHSLFISDDSEKTIHKGKFWTIDKTRVEDIKALDRVKLAPLGLRGSPASSSSPGSSLQKVCKPQPLPLPPMEPGQVATVKMYRPPSHTLKQKEVDNSEKTTASIVRIAAKAGSGAPLVHRVPLTSRDPGINTENPPDSEDKLPDVTEALKSLPSEYKSQLKTGLPVILRPLHGSSSSASVVTTTSNKSIVLQQSSVTLGHKNGEVKRVILAKPVGGGTTAAVSVNGGSGSAVKSVLRPREQTVKLNKTEFTKPPFSMIELIMISIYYSPAGVKRKHVPEICEKISLFFPYYRTTSSSDLTTLVKQTLKENNKIFQLMIGGSEGTPMYSFSSNCLQWQQLVSSDRWFNTPVDADLFAYMDENCQKFHEKVESMRNKMTMSAQQLATEPASKRLKLDESEDSVVSIKEEAFDMDLETLLPSDTDAFGEIVEEDPLAS